MSVGSDSTDASALNETIASVLLAEDFGGCYMEGGEELEFTAGTELLKVLKGEGGLGCMRGKEEGSLVLGRERGEFTALPHIERLWDRNLAERWLSVDGGGRFHSRTPQVDLVRRPGAGQASVDRSLIPRSFLTTPDRYHSTGQSLSTGIVPSGLFSATSKRRLRLNK